MTAYLRTETDEQGNAVEHHVYCGPYCYAQSLDKSPPIPEGEVGGIEEGGAWPCYEAPYDTYCPECEALVVKGSQEEDQ